jgi:hypothetical protein
MLPKPLKTENRLIYLLSRTEVSDSALEEIRTLLSKKLDWEKLINIAIKQRVCQLLYFNFNRYGLKSSIPEQVLAQVKYAYYVNLKRNLLFERELLFISEKTGTKGLNTIPFRGMSLIYNAYNNHALRYMEDIDILIEPEDLQKLENILTEIGYQQRPYTFCSMDECRITNFDKKISEDLYMTIEPHTAIAKARPYRMSLPYLWKRSIPINLGDKTISILSKEDLILSTAVHMRRHTRKLTLKFAVDTAAILSAGENTLDWDYIIKNAKDNHMVSNLYLSLYLAKELLDADVPLQVITRIKPNSFIDFLMRITINKHNFFFLTVARGTILRILTFDKPNDFFYYLWHGFLRLFNTVTIFDVGY